MRIFQIFDLKECADTWRKHQRGINVDKRLTAEKMDRKASQRPSDASSPITPLPVEIKSEPTENIVIAYRK